MGMFRIKAGSRVIVMTEAQMIHPQLGKRVVRSAKDTYFEKEELIIDPTGISKYASVPKEFHTIGGSYAKNGYYGFKRAEKSLYFITAHSNVDYR